jgi:hypothetical protein
LIFIHIQHHKIAPPRVVSSKLLFWDLNSVPLPPWLLGQIS